MSTGRLRIPKLLASLAGAVALGAALLSAAAPAMASPTTPSKPLTWSAGTSAEHAPYAEPGDLTALSCAGSKLCVGFDASGDVISSTDPAGGAAGWHFSPRAVPWVTGSPALSCVTGAKATVLCTAVDGGRPVTSTDPAGAWHGRTVTVTLDSVSCPSTSFCLAGGYGGVEYSTDPTGGASAWHAVKIGKSSAAYRVSCPSRSFCAAVNAAGGDVLTTSNPAGGASAWKTTAVDGTSGLVKLVGISCPSRSLCVATDTGGDVLTSTRPAGGASAWHHVDLGSIVDAIACPTSTVCVGKSTGAGELFTATDPTGAASAWHAGKVSWLPPDGEGGPGIAYLPLACGSASLCLGGNNYGDVAASVHPAGGASTWQAPVNVAGANVITAIACPSTSLCVAGDAEGNVVTSTDPAARKWSLAYVDGAPPYAVEQGITSVVCPDTRLCVATDPRGDVITSTDPAGGASAWQLIPTDGASFPYGGAVTDLQCPSAALCVGYNSGTGRLVYSTDPAGGASAWHEITPGVPGDFSFTSLDCPTATLCAAGDSAGEVWTATDPAGGVSAWHRVQPDGTSGQDVIDMACAGTRACVATDDDYQLITTTDPTSSSPAWQVVSPPDTSFAALNCPSTKLCFGSGYYNEEPAVWYSTNPAGGAATWSERAVSSGIRGRFGCLSPTFCIGPWFSQVKSSSTTGVGVLTNPTAKTGWAFTTIKPAVAGAAMAAVGCVSSTFCVAGDSNGDLYVGRPAS
jgi:hypothetical protein